VFDPEKLELRPAADLWIAGERVLGEKALGTERPEGVPSIDAAGCTLVPGLFDLHVHIIVPGGGMEAAMLLPPETNLRSHLYCGVLNAVDLHAHQGTIFALRKRSREEPDLARLFAAGAAFTVPEGHGTQFGIPANAVTSAEEVGKLFDELLAEKPDVIKAILEHGGWSMLPEMPTLDEPLYAAIAERAKRAGVPLFTHVWSAEEAELAAAHGTRALAHGVFVGAVEPELAATMKAKGVAYIPTLSVVVAGKRSAEGKKPYDEALCLALDPEIRTSVTSGGSSTWATMGAIGGGEKQHFANLKALSDAGVEIGAGTDAGNPLTPHGPALIAELALYVEAGLSPAQALRAATLSAAKILGVDKDQGSLEPGKLADIVVVRGEPTRSIADLAKVEHVVKAGTPVDRAAIVKKNDRVPIAASKKRAGSELSGRIDGFDDGDASSDWGGAWMVITDQVTGQGKSTGEIQMADGTLRMKGSVAQGFPWGAWSSAVLMVDPMRKETIDATGFEGVRLRIRGTDRTYSLTVPRAAVKDYNDFLGDLAVTPEWTTVEIPFAKLRQRGIPGAKVMPWASDDLVGVQIDAVCPFGATDYGDFEFEVDWIELYKAE
jgi:imidazolonepropionase-like amidohydrolase